MVGIPAVVLPVIKAKGSWLVLPFHPVWCASGLSAAINRIFLKWKPSLVEAGEDVEDLIVRISWPLGCQTLASLIKACNADRSDPN